MVSLFWQHKLNPLTRAQFSWSVGIEQVAEAAHLGLGGLPEPFTRNPPVLGFLAMISPVYSVLRHVVPGLIEILIPLLRNFVCCPGHRPAASFWLAKESTGSRVQGMPNPQILSPERQNPQTLPFSLIPK